MWFVGSIGLLGALVAMVFSFIPPTQIGTGSPAVYVGILLAGSAIFVAIPFAFYAFHKPSWKAADSDFEPFEVRQASSASKPAQPLRPAIAEAQ